jgi:hypothetical protein
VPGARPIALSFLIEPISSISQESTVLRLTSRSGIPTAAGKSHRAFAWPTVLPATLPWVATDLSMGPRGSA